MLVTSEMWSWLKAARILNDQELLFELQARLPCSFEQFFYLIRTQKVLSRSRDAGTTNRLCEGLATWCRTAPLSGARKSKLIRHCAVTQAFQEMMSALRAETAELEFWSLTLDDLGAIVLSSCEAAISELATRNRAWLSKQSTVEESLHGARNSQAVARDTLDQAMRILDEGRRRCAGKSDYDRASSEAFVKALDVAKRTDQVALVWDAYCFSDIPVKLVGKTLRLYKPNEQQLRSLYSFAERSHMDDLLQQGQYIQSMLAARAKLQLDAVAAQFPDFISFLSSPSAKNYAKDMEAGTLLFSEFLKKRLRKLVDLEKYARVGTVRATYSEIISLWSSVLRLAMLAAGWSEARYLVFGEMPPCILRTEDIADYSSLFFPESWKSIARLDKLIISERTQKGALDLFYRPFFRLLDGQLLVAPTVIEIARVDRNILQMIAQEVNASLSEKGAKPISLLRPLFERAGFRVKLGLIVGSTAGTATDIDILASKEDKIFIFQCKVLGVSDGSYEYWRNSQRLEHAAEQMRLSVEYCQNNWHDICSLMQVSEGSSLHPYLLTNIWNQSDESVGGYRVTDFDRVEHILEGAYLQMVDLQNIRTIARKSIIAGEFPTAKELLSLLDQKAPVRSRPTLEDMTLRIGEWTLVLPSEDVFFEHENLAEN